MKENLTKCYTGIWSFVPYLSLLNSIQYGINNLARSIVIRSIPKTVEKRKESITIDGEILVEIFIEENNTTINFDKIKHPAFIINEKWEITKEINFDELLVEIAVDLGDIEKERIKLSNACKA